MDADLGALLVYGDAQRAHAAKRRVAIGSRRVIVDLRLTFGNGSEHGIAVRDGLVAWQANGARDTLGRGNPLFHEEFPILAGCGALPPGCSAPGGARLKLRPRWAKPAGRPRSVAPSETAGSGNRFRRWSQYTARCRSPAFCGYAGCARRACACESRCCTPTRASVAPAAG